VPGQTKRAIIILIAVLVVMTPLALVLINQNTQLSGSAVIPGDEQAVESASSGDSGSSGSSQSESSGDSGQSDTPPDSGAPADSSQPGDTSGQPPAPTSVPPTAVAPTPVPSTPVSPTDIPPTAVPPTDVPPTVAPTAPAETTTEPVAEVTETPPPEAEVTEVPTEEATSEVELTPEATPELEVTAELTPELTPEATEAVSGFEISVACTSSGTSFVVTNLGDDMSTPETYFIDGNESGEVLLSSGGSQTIDAGFGTPSLAVGGVEAQPGEPCTPPPDVSVTVDCTLESGLIFVVTNTGGAMRDPADYTVGDASGTFQLSEGESVEISAGYGSPAFSSGDINIQVDPACEPPAHVEGRVWLDTNGDGLFAEGETGIGGLTVALINADGYAVETLTTDDGHYDFFPVGAGNYTIDLRTDNLPADVEISYDPDGENDAQTGVIVTAGENYTVDFGYQPIGTASITGIVWLETENFGAQDADETGLSGAVVQLINLDGSVVAEMPVEADGSYLFEALGAGDYVVHLVADTLPRPYGITFNNDDQNDLETAVSLTSGQSVSGINFGVVGAF
jgi:hypothetical protein